MWKRHDGIEVCFQNIERVMDKLLTSMLYNGHVHLCIYSLYYYRSKSQGLKSCLIVSSSQTTSHLNAQTSVKINYNKTCVVESCADFITLSCFRNFHMSGQSIKLLLKPQLNSVIGSVHLFDRYLSPPILPIYFFLKNKIITKLKWMHRTKAMRNVTWFLRDEVAQSGNLSLFFFFSRWWNCGTLKLIRHWISFMNWLVGKASWIPHYFF